jgi:hypothetical protein
MLISLAVGLGVLACVVALGGQSVAGLELKWLLSLLPAAGAVGCVAVMIESTRRGERPRSWLLTWIGIYLASALAGVGAEVVLPGSWFSASLLSVTLLCFAAGWVALRRGRARA